MSDATLIFDKGRPGRRGSTVPALDVPPADGLGGGPRRTAAAELPEASELEVVRHFTNLSRKNMAIDTNFYPLGSCTMKYNPKFHEVVANLPGFAGLHPLLPQLRGGGALTQGALGVIYELEQWLNELLGFAAFTMQPLAGAHGELTGTMLIAKHHAKNGQDQRKVMLIPEAAHGTNPATAAMCGFTVRELGSDEHGNVCMESLKEALANPDEIAGLMLTCPSTVGLYDQNVEEICRLVHEAGGLCYCDGANLNAIMGRVRPGDVGFDVMHVNLHKTFSTPHGGGGPGSGVVGVAAVLEPYLPVSRVVKGDDGRLRLGYDYPESIGYIAAFYGNFGMLLRAYAYALTLGREGMIRVGENAVLNANYLRVKLAGHLDIAYDRACMHECVFTASRQAKDGVHALDISKGLLDKGFHPPTMYFPLVVPEALMIEPTETESIETLDLFIEAMIEVLEEGKKDPDFLHAAPRNFPVTRLDETRAARKPDVASL